VKFHLGLKKEQHPWRGIEGVHWGMQINSIEPFLILYIEKISLFIFIYLIEKKGKGKKKLYCANKNSKISFNHYFTHSIPQLSTRILIQSMQMVSHSTGMQFPCNKFWKAEIIPLLAHSASEIRNLQFAHF
jgi:hypothetical protein